MMAGALALLGLAAGLLAAGPPAPTARAAFYAAAERARSGDAAGAAVAFEEVARRFPGEDLAPDALLEAAQLREERLADPEGALGLYQALGARYPQSRLARRAATRAAFLQGALGAGPEPLRAYEEVTSSYARRPHADSIARMEDILRRFPAFPLAPQASFWLAEAYHQERRWDDALRRYADIAARWPASDFAARAEKATGDLWLERGDLRRARAAYDRLAARGGPFAELAGSGRQMVRTAWQRRIVRWGSVAVIGLFCLGYGLRAWRTRPPVLPVELKYYLPVAGAFLAAALTEHRAIFRATLILAAVGGLVTFLLPQRRAPLRRPLLHALAVAAVVCAAFVLAVDSQHLTDMFLETLRTGAER